MTAKIYAGNAAAGKYEGRPGTSHESKNPDVLDPGFEEPPDEQLLRSGFDGSLPAKPPADLDIGHRSPTPS